MSLPDAYLSVVEALKHGGYHHGAKVEIEWIQAEEVQGLLVDGRLRDLDGIVIPGGFGERGIEGKMAAAGYAREHLIPCLGLCLGLQMMTIEFARNVLGLAGANSTEFDPATPHPVIDLMDTQRDVTEMGGTMRLGAYVAELVPDSTVARAYGKTVVSERHRHRYEFNPRYRGKFEGTGFVCSGESPDGRLVEFIELDNHPFWVGTQAHPEFTSRPNRPGPLFREFIGAGARPGRGPPAAPVPRRRTPVPSAPRERRRWGRGRRVPHPRRHDGLDRQAHPGRRGAGGRARRHRPRTRGGPPPRGRGRGAAARRRDGHAGPPVPVAVDADLWEIPAGLRDVEGEPPAETASRELVEEAGLEAGHLEFLVSFHNSPGFTDERVDVYLATGLTPVPDDRQGVEEAHMVVEPHAARPALAMIDDGRITDAKTVIGLLLVARPAEVTLANVVGFGAPGRRANPTTRSPIWRGASAAAAGPAAAARRPRRAGGGEGGAGAGRGAAADDGERQQLHRLGVAGRAGDRRVVGHRPADLEHLVTGPAAVVVERHPASLVPAA